jgi:Uma2 family endonuclease
MATRSQARTSMTLEEFLKWPRIDERPYLEFIDDRIEVKVSPQTLHSVLQDEILEGLNRVARPSRIGRAFPELRCTFAGLSIVPDVVFLLEKHIQVDAYGRYANDIQIPPDIHVEVRSRRQSIKKSQEKLAHSVANDCPLGWFLDPERETIDVFRPGQPPERRPNDGFLDANPILPGFRVAVAEVFGWLIHRKPGADPR